MREGLIKMDLESIALKLQETTDRSLRNEGRIKKLENDQRTLQDIAKATAVMAEQIKNMNANVETLSNKVDHLEEKPKKRWDGLVDKIIWAVAAAVIAFLLAQIGL